MKEFLKLIFHGLIFFFFINNKLMSQDIVRRINKNNPNTEFNAQFQERILIISESKKIFILSNESKQLGRGDFITIALNNQSPVARALVAKEDEGKVAIKILKLYSLKNWSQLYQGLDVLIYRGDDSDLFKNQENPAKVAVQEKTKISSEEDLYKEIASLEAELGEFGDKDRRLIKPDNIFGIATSQYKIIDTVNDQTLAQYQLLAQWAYQFYDNYWFEAMIGRVSFNNFPASSQTTVISSYGFRFKATFKAPLYSFIMPYLGYEITQANNPRAGKSTNMAQNIIEDNAIQSINKRDVVFGVSILRRLVPGWFLTFDIHSSGFNGGFAVEF